MTTDPTATEDSPSMKKWIPVIVLTALLMGGGAYWFHSRPYDASRLVQMLPPDRSSYVYLDVGLLRAAGVLDTIAGSKALEDPDYKKFVEEAGFDYRTDLDAVAIAFRDGDRFIAAQGRFSWDKLSAYAQNHQGSCDRNMCRVPGSTPGKTVSYYLPRVNVLALATSKNATAGDMVAPGTWNKPPQIPPAALWVLAPPYAFTDLSGAPAGTKSFLTPLAGAAETVLTLGPSSGNDKDLFELKMQVTNATPAGAVEVGKRFTDVTELFTKMLVRDNMQPKPDDLSAVLVAGKFTVKDTQVVGTWPIHRSFLESLANPSDAEAASPAAPTATQVPEQAKSAKPKTTGKKPKTHK